MGVFTAVKGLAGFPFLLRTKALPVVEQQIAHGKFSLQALAMALRATTVEAGARAAELVNINTAGELDRARRRAATFRPKAPEGWRSPKAGAGSKRG
jgi:CTP:molybdopterin cytidylyltransferase MocA